MRGFRTSFALMHTLGKANGGSERSPSCWFLQVAAVWIGPSQLQNIIEFEESSRLSGTISGAQSCGGDQLLSQAIRAGKG